MTNDLEKCECGVAVRLSDKWWHRSVCPAWQQESRPVESIVEIVARAVAESEGAGSWQAYVDIARAAIKAMRTPTATMVDAGANTVWNRDALVSAYQAMIDRAGEE